jgi:hypothetical protein
MQAMVFVGRRERSQFKMDCLAKGSRIQFSRTIGALNAIIRLSSDIDSYRAVRPSRMSEDKTRDKTREPEFYSGSYNVADNDAAKPMLCNKTADVFLL